MYFSSNFILVRVEPSFIELLQNRWNNNEKEHLPVKTRGKPLPNLLGGRGQRVARCQNTACMSAQRSGLGEEELALLTLSGWERKVGGLWLTEPTERESISHRVAGLGRRQTQGKNKPIAPPSAKYYCTESGKFKRSQEYLVLFPPPHTQKKSDENSEGSEEVSRFFT